MADEKPPLYADMEKTPVNDKNGALPAPLLQVVQHATDADEAMKAFEGHDGEVLVLDEFTNRRLLRKIDLNILPVCVGRQLQRHTSDVDIANVHCLRSQLP